MLPGVWFLYLHDFSFRGLSLPAGTCFALSKLQAAMNKAFLMDFSTSLLVSHSALCGAETKALRYDGIFNSLVVTCCGNVPALLSLHRTNAWKPSTQQRRSESQALKSEGEGV